MTKQEVIESLKHLSDQDEVVISIDKDLSDIHDIDEVKISKNDFNETVGYLCTTVRISSYLP